MSKLRSIESAMCKITSPVNKAMIYATTAVMSFAPFLIEANADGADALFGRATEALQKVLNGLTSVVNIVAAVCAIIALLFLIFSKSQRAVESAKEWLKRIVVAWVAVNCMGWIFDFFVNLTAGGGLNTGQL